MEANCEVSKDQGWLGCNATEKEIQIKNSKPNISKTKMIRTGLVNINYPLILK